MTDRCGNRDLLKRLGLSRYALVVAGGEEDDSIVELFGGADLKVAADKGAAFLDRYDLTPDILIGDFDSCPKSLVESFKKKGVKIVGLEVAKDKTDTEAALALVLNAGFKRAVVAAALGGDREDHAVANVFLMDKFRRENLEVVLWSKGTFVFCLSQGKRVIKGFPGDWVSLIPLTEKVCDVTASSLKFPLRNAVLERGSSLGVSNEMIKTEASIEAGKGVLMVFLSHREKRRLRSSLG